MANLSNNTIFLNIKKDSTVTYIVKNSSSKDKLKSYLKSTGIDPIHVIIVDNKIEPLLNGEEIGYRMEAPTIIKKDKNGRIL